MSCGLQKSTAECWFFGVMPLGQGSRAGVKSVVASFVWRNSMGKQAAGKGCTMQVEQVEAERQRAHPAGGLRPGGQSDDFVPLDHAQP